MGVHVHNITSFKDSPDFDSAVGSIPCLLYMPFAGYLT